MDTDASRISRRDRNKQAKLDRIIAAATELFAAHGVDGVTTQQIADRADIGAGTLFLYARNKGELLLLVQNALYADALSRGRGAAAAEQDVLQAVLAIVTPIVECNRAQVENGRTYLREMVFGDPTEPHHAAALAIVAQTEAAIAEVLGRDAALGPEEPAIRARIVTAVMLLSMAAGPNAGASTEDVVAEIAGQVRVLLRG
jgi:TetR/AcrR family transcriptional regulator